MSGNDIIEFGAQSDENLRWAGYGLQEYPVLFNDNATWLKAITRNGELVNMVSKRYKLLPNEEVAKLADSAAQVAGLVPFSEFSGDWYTKMSDHIIYDNDQYRIHALYAMNQPYTIQGDKMHLGVGIHNAIDGSMGFGCGIFTFRHACANMVLAGMKNWEMSFDQRKTLEYVYKKHVGAEFEILTGKLAQTVQRIMERVPMLISWYDQLAVEKATKEMVQRLQKSTIPKKVLPPYLQIEKGQTQIQVPKKTQWEVYNDVTRLIWHNGKTDITSKITQFATLHSALMPSQMKARGF